MSQDIEREAFERRMLDFGWRNFTGDVQGEPPCWYYANADLNARWIGWREARAAIASHPPAVQGEIVAEVYRAHYGGRQRNIGFNNLRALINLDTLTVGTKLYASPPSREPQWQPIETAPKDGTAFWAFSPDLIDPEFNPNGGAECAWNGDEFIAWAWNPHQDFSYGAPTKPTHWMPLPPPPGIHSRGEGEKA